MALFESLRLLLSLEELLLPLYNFTANLCSDHQYTSICPKPLAVSHTHYADFATHSNASVLMKIQIMNTHSYQRDYTLYRKFASFRTADDLKFVNRDGTNTDRCFSFAWSQSV